MGLALRRQRRLVQEVKSLISNAVLLLSRAFRDDLVQGPSGPH